MTKGKSVVRVRVRYAETDQMGVTYYGTYPVYLEVARTEYCRERGYPYTELEKQGIGIVVAEMWLRYRKPTAYDDPLDIRVWVENVGSRKIDFRYEVMHGDDLCVEAYTRHVFVDMIEKRPIQAPVDLLARLTDDSGANKTTD